MKLENYGLKVKMLIIVLLPLGLMLYFTTSVLNERKNTVQAMSELTELSEFNVIIGNYIHETQRERGFSSMYIGSKGAKGGTELHSQRKNTDNAFKILQEKASDILLTEKDTSICNPIKRSLSEINKIEDIRSAVDAQSISAIDAAKYYTNINGHLIDIVFFVVNSCDQAELIKEINSFAYLLKEKEMAGLERAILSAVFSADSFNLAQKKSLITAISLQEESKRQFLISANSSEKENYFSAYKKDFAIETQRMRTLALEKMNIGKFGVAPEYWFEKQTMKIDLLKSLEDEISKNLILTAENIKSAAQNAFLFYLIVSILGICFVLFAGFLIIQRIVGSIRRVIDVLKDISTTGNIDVEIDNSGRDEVAKINSSINQLILMLKESSSFAHKIGNNELNAEFYELSSKDVLRKSLLDMRDRLVEARQNEENRIKEDENRNWSTSGYAKFAEILRQNNDNMELLTYDVIKNLVSYLGANQGGMFILNDSDKEHPVLEMTACYAYNRRKYLENTIPVGEGLVGTCFIEAQTIFLTDVPEDYLNITSGLGKDNPGCIVIVPLKLNDVVYGIMEIASFEVIPQYKVEFLERIGESIASTLSSVKVNMRTAQLLEISQMQADEMRQQEEEMRQNMEEMHATQEEMGRKSAEMQGLISALNASVYIMEFDMDGKIKNVNNELCKILKMNMDQIRGRNHRDFNPFEGQEEFWAQLKTGNIQQRTSIYSVHGKKIWLAETYTPIFDVDGIPVNVLNIAIDISVNKELEMDMQEQAKEMQTQQEELRQNMEELTAIQEQLEAKDIEQQKEIARLNDENQAKLEEIARKEAESVKLMERSQAKEFEMSQKIARLTDLVSKHGINDELNYNSTEFIPWSDEFSVSIIDIDNQHKRLFQLINDLYKAFTEGSARGVMGNILNELADYTVVHFGNEEKMFSDHKYPQTSEHIDEHKKLVAQVLEFKNAFDKGEVNVSYDLMNFLKSWLFDHIQKVDKQYSKHFNDLGIK